MPCLSVLRLQTNTQDILPMIKLLVNAKKFEEHTRGVAKGASPHPQTHTHTHKIMLYNYVNYMDKEKLVLPQKIKDPWAHCSPAPWKNPSYATE